MLFTSFKYQWPWLLKYYVKLQFILKKGKIVYCWPKSVQILSKRMQILSKRMQILSKRMQILSKRMQILPKRMQFADTINCPSKSQLGHCEMAIPAWIGRNVTPGGRPVQPHNVQSFDMQARHYRWPPADIMDGHLHCIARYTGTIKPLHCSCYIPGDL